MLAAQELQERIQATEHMESMLDTYRDNCSLQETCQTIGNPILADMSAEYVQSGSPRSFRIAEYGCSGARNSLLPIQSIVAPVRGKDVAVRMECILNDVPSNCWHQVMQEARKITAAFDGAIKVLCAGTSFYNQVCAAESIDVAFSYVAAHFLSGCLPMKSHVLMHEACATERAAWEEAAARDWREFLLLRARELKPGGKLMISTMSRDGNGYSWQRFSHLVWDSILTLGLRGLLTQGEMELLCIPACLRSEQEIMAPFSADTDLKSLLTVNCLEFGRTEIRGEAELPKGIHASLLRKRVEAVWGGMFLAQLQGAGRRLASAIEVMSEMWDKFEEAVGRDVSHGWTDMQAFYLQVTKKPSLR